MHRRGLLLGKTMPRYAYVLATLILLSVLIFGFLALRFGWRKWARTASRQNPPPLARINWVPLLVPDIDLQLNDADGDETTVYQGVPLVFSVALGNQRALSAALQNRSNELFRSHLEAKIARGEISPQQAEPILSKLGKSEIPVIQLGRENTAWPAYVHFVKLSRDGKEEPLGWPIQVAKGTAAGTVSLDEKTTLRIQFLLSPLEAARLPLGNYEIAAVLDVPENGNLVPGSWHGRVSSESLKLNIVARPEHLKPELEEEFDLQFAYYYQATNDQAEVLQFAEKALRAVPHSIAARIIVAMASEERGDFRAALDYYQDAETQFYRQHPEAYEPPMYLIHKSMQLRKKLERHP